MQDLTPNKLFVQKNRYYIDKHTHYIEDNSYAQFAIQKKTKITKL